MTGDPSIRAKPRLAVGAAPPPPPPNTPAKVAAKPAAKADGIDAPLDTLPSNSSDARVTVPPSPGEGSASKGPQPLPAHAKGFVDGVAALKPRGPAFAAATQQVKTIVAEIGEHIRNGRYAEARAAFDRLDGISVAQGMKRIGADDLMGPVANATQLALRQQLDFQIAMSEALPGRTVNMPPTLAQLKEYFSTFRGNPSGAREAFERYCNAYQVHPAFVKGAGTGINYSSAVVYSAGGEIYKTEKEARAHGDVTEINVGGPQTWADVTMPKRRVETAGDNAGKTVNDCEGYVMIATQLFGAAGFTVDSYVSAVGNDSKKGHAMVVLRDEENQYTVVSNGVTYGPSDDADRLLTRAWRDTQHGSETPHFGRGDSPGVAGGRARLGL